MISIITNQKILEELIMQTNEKKVAYINEYNRQQMITKNTYPTFIAERILKEYKAQDKYIKTIFEDDVIYLYDGKKGVWEKTIDDYIKKDIRQFLIKHNNDLDKRNSINEVFSALEDITADKENKKLFNLAVNPDLRYINLENGMYDTEKQKLLDHDPEYYSICQIPVEYNSKAECSKWKEALKQWIPDKKTIMFLQEYVGHCLIPDTRHEKAIILLGEGNNGKSTFLEVISRLFGEDNLSGLSIDRLTKKSRFETANLKDKLVNIYNDVDPKIIKDTGLIKTIISGQTLRAEKKYITSQDTKLVSRLIFAANRLPKAVDAKRAWYRRFEIVRFPNSFTPNDDCFDIDYKYKLCNELSGILNWALEGLHRLKQNNVFTTSASLKKEKLKYKGVNDPIESFYESKIVDSPGNVIDKKEVYGEYVKFCEQLGIEAETQRTLTMKLKDLGIESKRKSINGDKIRCYLGIKLK